MPTLTLKTTAEKNSDMPMSVSELRARHFLGIDIVDPEGNSISDDTIKFYLNSAQQELENFLEVKLNKTIIQESHDYSRNEFSEWGHLNTNFPVLEAIKLSGQFTSKEQIVYPSSWLREKNTNAGQQNLVRRVNLMPFTGDAAEINTVFVGAFPYMPMAGTLSGRIPEYWHLTYCTGWNKADLPKDIMSAMGKMAAIPIFHMLGDIILANAGIGSQSISIDGLSQSVNTTAGVENAGYGARITQYKKELEVELKTLKGLYNGDIKMVSV